MKEVLRHCNQITIENFLPRFDELRAYADRAEYGDVQSDVDGVTYPGISMKLPEFVVDDVVNRLTDVMGPVTINTLFMRLSTEGMVAPHQAHTDAVMGEASLMVYLTPEPYCQGGTAFVRHKENGMDLDPVTDSEVAVWQKDVNNPDMWDTLEVCEMRPNRACIFNAARMHCAHPIGGFGDSAKNGRLVLTAFFS